MPVYSDCDDVVNGRKARQYDEDEPHEAGPLDLAEVVVEVEDEVVGKGEADHQVGDGQVEHELVGDKRGEPPTQRHREDGERVPAYDEHHQSPVDDAPRPVVVQVRSRARLGRVPRPVALIAQYNVHNIAGRGRQRPPLGKVRRRGRLHAHSGTFTVTYHSRFRVHD